MAYVLQQVYRPIRCSCSALPEESFELPNKSQRAQYLQHTGLQQRQLQQQQQQQLGLRLTPGRKFVQLWKTKRPRRQRRLLDAPTDPDDPWWGTTKRERREALQQEREAQYGPHAADRDVRLYLKRREMNAARVRPSRRGGFPLDDSFSQPATFLKLSTDFQRTVLLERVEELVSTLPQLSPESAWQLYTTTPGLLTFTTLEVAQRLTGLFTALALNTADTLHYLCTYRPLAFLQPDTVRSRVGLCAKVSRLDVGAAVRLMQQHPALWLMSSRRLGPRVEQLSLLLRCCPVTSLRLLGSCPQLLTAPLHSLQQQLSVLCSLMGCAGQPQQVVPLLLCQPSLLLDQPAPGLQQQQQQPVSALRQQQQQILNPGSAADTQQQRHSLLGPTLTHQQQQQQQQQQVKQQQQGLGGAPVAAVQEQLQHLSTGLGLPMQLVQDMVLRAPELLALAAAGPDAIAAACSAISSSWLLTPHEEAVQRRQAYQQHLLQELRPQQYSSAMKRRKVRQGLELAGVCWHDAAQVMDASVVRCQWWTAEQQQQQAQQKVQLGGSGQVLALQQLLLQAPALLLLASGPGLGPQQAAGIGQDALTSSSAPAAAAAAAAAIAVPPGLPAGADSYQAEVSGQGGDVLGHRLQELCDHLLALFEQQQQQEEQQQQQQQQSAAGQGAGQTHSAQHQPGHAPPKQRQQSKHRSLQQSQEQLASVIKQAAVLEPCLLAQPPGWVAAQLLQLSKALQVPVDSMWALVVQHPAILWLTQPQLFERIRVLCGVLKLPAHDVKHLVAGADAVQLLLLHSEAVRRGFVSAVMGVAASESAVRRALLKQPAALLPGRTKEWVSQIKKM